MALDIVSGGDERYERERIASELSSNAIAAFGRTWGEVELALLTVLDGSPAGPRATRAELEEMETRIRYLEGLTWTLGLNTGQRGSLKRLRRAVRDLRRAGNEDNPSKVDECQRRLVEARVATGAERRGWSPPVVRAATPARDPAVPIAVAVVDDGDGDRLARRLDALSTEALGIAVVGVTVTASEGVLLVDGCSPDVVFVGTALSDGPGVGAVRAARPEGQPAGIIAVSATWSDERLLAAFRDGAAGYITYDTPDAELIAVVRRVALGDFPINDALLSDPARDPS